MDALSSRLDLVASLHDSVEPAPAGLRVVAAVLYILAAAPAEELSAGSGRHKIGRPHPPDTRRLDVASLRDRRFAVALGAALGEDPADNCCNDCRCLGDFGHMVVHRHGRRHNHASVARRDRPGEAPVGRTHTAADIAIGPHSHLGDCTDQHSAGTCLIAKGWMPIVRSSLGAAAHMLHADRKP